MDERTLALLQADITSQVALIDTIFARLQERAHDLQPNNEAQLESVAFQFLLLNGLRSFRHFFRHAYAAPIEFPHLQINLDKAEQAYPRLKRDVDSFVRQIGGSL